MKHLILLPVAVLAVWTANAQLALMPEAGLNLSTMTIKVHDPINGGGTASTSLRTSVTAGAMAEYGFSSRFYVQGGLFYTSAGCKIATDTFIKESAVEVPLTLEYKQGSPGGSRFYVGIGPYVAYAFAGKTNINGGNRKLEFGNDSASDIKAPDWGVTAHVGVLLANSFYLRVRYQSGLMNLQPNDHSGNSIKTSAIGITIGCYLLEGKERKQHRKKN